MSTWNYRITEYLRTHRVYDVLMTGVMLLRAITTIVLRWVKLPNQFPRYIGKSDADGSWDGYHHHYLPLIILMEKLLVDCIQMSSQYLMNNNKISLEQKITNPVFTLFIV
ncbi:uncharacterized protein LOC141535537 [Cotesia typhae]|uniref:uncharacterized protein LOC141535537 n=1 Tax=Cotesia typhae TaxID=2053667 RepID=UPI003D6800AC